MSQENVEVVQELFDAVGGGNIEAPFGSSARRGMGRPRLRDGARYTTRTERSAKGAHRTPRFVR